MDNDDDDDDGDDNGDFVDEGDALVNMGDAWKEEEEVPTVPMVATMLGEKDIAGCGRSDSDSTTVPITNTKPGDTNIRILVVVSFLICLLLL
mmetsp:Transcript_25895/g.38766  ORF Transcript_25895/g.38766 Transcript_25895/m.38766 type:complete len:92 (-) Transcript_25895:203-478(-)